MTDLREVAPGVLVATSRRMSTNSTLLVSGSEVLLIDPAWMPDELDALASEIARRGLHVIGGFATHAHHDHLLWHPDFGDAPRWASSRTAELATSEREALVSFLGDDFPTELVALMGQVRTVDRIPAESVPAGFEIEVIVHDGHAPGHSALWLPKQRVLIAGDMLSDIELPLPFYPDDIPSYVAALDLLEPYARQASVVVPGHGHVGQDAHARLQADRRYLANMMTGGASDDPRTRDPEMAEAHAHMKEIC